MGCCVSLPDDTEENHSLPQSNEKKPLSTTETDNELVEVKIQSMDPWQYSTSLTMQEATTMLEDITFDDCKLFVAPIKYAKVVKVYDGDTVHIVAPLFDGVLSRFKVRLARIDAPELRTKDAWEKKAGYIVRDILNDKIGHQIVQITNVSYDKYGRILGDILLNEENINDWLLDIDWACPYSGKGDKLVKKTNWKAKVLKYEKTQVES
eukprot:557079_1